jgi:hemerythrin
MAISGWHPRYSTGITIIDEQHQEIFLALARLKAAVHMHGEGEDVSQLLDYFDLLTQRHFKTEEDFLRLHGFPELEAHQAEHARAQANLRELKDRYAENPEALVAMIVTFVNGWLTHHISEGDFRYVTFLKDRGV